MSTPVKVVITYIAEEKDWDIDSILDGRPISHPEAQKDLLEAFREDLLYIFNNSHITFSKLKPCP
jgi:hypothetical protein